MYDIFNIYESLNLIKKVSKRKYQWLGLQQCLTTITAILESKNEDVNHEEKRITQSLKDLASCYLNFIVLSETAPMSMIGIAEKMIKEYSTFMTLKTLVRRLFDIFSVFKSIGLIKNVTLNTFRKTSAFYYVGTDQFRHHLNVLRERRKSDEKEGKKYQDLSSEE